ncbi:rhodanese-like domain-containing protein [Empedobacter brevis]|uniref:Rhodanese-like domain-containing protein n=2 Tax=Empedobacter brevis TaxID=247 RepID=A0AAJ1QHE2_9FLAO|nr:rhodanese-like domain-containing protein [Empedobacter brevis]
MLGKIIDWIKNRKRIIKMTTVEAINNANVTLVDVRELYELDVDGFVPNAINIPLGDVPTKVEEFKAMSRPIVVFCRSGNRSGQAAQYLQSQGVDEIFNGGGFQDVLDILEK